MDHPGVPGGKARVGGKLRVSDGGKDSAGEMFRGRADGHVAVGRLEDSEWREPRHRASGARWQAARFEQVERLRRHE